MKQPTALRLADALDCHDHIGMSKAAAELRRLHEANQAMLDALKLTVRQNSHDMLMTGEELRKCESAIAKGEQP